MIGYFKKTTKDDVPVSGEPKEDEVLDCSEECSDDKNIDYYSITTDPCEPYIDKIVNVLKERFSDVGTLSFVELPIDFDVTSQMDLDDAYAKYEMVSEHVNTLLDTHCSNEYYEMYKKTAYSHERLDGMDDFKLGKFYETVNVIKSEMLRDVLVKKGITSADYVRYLCDPLWISFRKRYEIESELRTVLSRMGEVQKEYISKGKLSKELDIIGREYRNISRLDLNGVFDHVPDGALPVVNVVITETGVHLIFDINVRKSSNLRITSEGALMYRVENEWSPLYGYSAINRKMSYLMGNVSSLIKQRIGKSIKVNGVILANSNVTEIMNYSTRKVITIDTLYDTVYNDADRGELSDDEIEEVYNLLASLNTYDNTVEMFEVSEEMFATWEHNLKFLDDVIVARGLINDVIKGDDVR